MRHTLTLAEIRKLIDNSKPKRKALYTVLISSGMPSNRIEDGNVAWEVTFRTCTMCQEFSSFYVDVISGKILDTRNIDEMFAAYTE